MPVHCALYILAAATVVTSVVGASWTNWNGEQSCTPSVVVNVTTEAEAVAAIAAASNLGGGVRVLGRGHSFSPIDLSNGTLIRVLAPSTGAVVQLSPITVRVHAGLHLWELNAALEQLGLGLPNLGAISNQTLAGATSTNTHGTGCTGGTSTFIIAARIVLPNATAVTVSATANAPLFNALRTGYGAFGVLITLDLNVWPLWRMERVTAPVPLPTLLSMLPSLLAQYERLQWYYTPYSDNATLVVRANSSGSVTGCWAGAPYSTPSTPPPVGMSAWPVGTVACTDVSYKVLTSGSDDAFLYTEMEMMVPVESHLQLMKEFIDFQTRVQPQHDASVGLFTGVRYVEADDILLSPFHGRRTAVVSMIIIGNATDGGNQAEVQLYDRGLEALAFANYSARPHPGKMNWFTADMMSTVYADTFAAFQAQRSAVDPTNMFVNEYTARLFGLA